MTISHGTSLEPMTVGDAGRSTSSGAEELVRSFVSDRDDILRYRCCSGNVVVLSLTAFLFALITAVQWYFGSVVTHSEALLADCNCMLVDALTYLLNIFAEVAPARMKRRLQLLVPAISLSILTGLTLSSVIDANDTIQDGGGDDDVNSLIVWSFGFAGLIFDIISIYAFWRNKKAKNHILPVNMLAAFMHVGADFLRSVVTTVEGFFLMAKPEWNSGLIDAWSCVVIAVLVFLGIFFALYEVVSDVRTYYRTGQ